MDIVLNTTTETTDEETQKLLRRRSVYKHLNALQPDVVAEYPHGKIIIISYSDEYEVALSKFSQKNISILGISFLWKSEIKEKSIFSTSLGIKIPVIPLSKLKGYVYAKKFVVYPKRESRIETQYFRTRRILAEHGINHYATLESELDFLTARRFVLSKPNIFVKNINKIAEVCSLLSSQAEKDTYLRFIMGMLTRNKSYTRQSQKTSYYHPEVPFQEGDVVIDAGVSGDIITSKFISKQCGETGKVFGFEPDQEAFNIARQEFETEGLNNYELIPEGLWKESTRAFISKKTKGRSAVLSLNPPLKGQAISIETCSLTSVDDFVEKRELKKVDAIKMDIEGAEPDALFGSILTIKKHKPKLYISIYHDFTHMYEIPLLLKQLNPKYQLYIEQHSWNLYDLTLFAIEPSQSAKDDEFFADCDGSQDIEKDQNSG